MTMAHLIASVLRNTAAILVNAAERFDPTSPPIPAPRTYSEVIRSDNGIGTRTWAGHLRDSFDA